METESVEGEEMSRDDGGKGETPRQVTHFADDATLAHIADLERELSAKTADLDACRADAIEQARLVGMGAEREARLMAQLEACRAVKAKMLEGLECLLPGLVLDLRYATEDDDTDAMQARIETVTECLDAARREG